MTAKFTPGPWTIDRDKEGRCFINGAPNGPFICTVDQPLDGCHHEGNAHLISASPELYESLKVIMDGFAQGIFVRSTAGDDDSGWAVKLLPFIAALGKAQNAIRKIEGR